MSHAVLGFDPYVSWLGVESPQRPASPYELLRLEPLESNAIRIEAGCTRQRQALERFRANADPATWSEVRDAVEQAIATLKSASRKALLDASIIRRRAATGSRRTEGKRAPAGATIACRKCHRDNPSQRQFCSDCGVSLWDHCRACEAEVACDEKFCGICGADLVIALNADFSEARAQMEEAARLRKQSEYRAAVAVLHKLGRSHDPRLDEIAEDAVALIDDIEQEIKQHEQRAADALDRARMLLSGFAYDGAVAELEDIPPYFRTEEINQALTDAHARRKELLMLGGEIRQAVEQKQTAGLLPKLERLLALKPNHEQATKLAVQLRDRLLASAEQKLGQHQYAEALKRLNQIPAFMQSPVSKRLTDDAEELQWFVDDFALAPAVDDTFVQLVERFAKAAPSHPMIAPLKDKLAQRKQREAADARHRYIAWASPAEESHVGCPVDWLTGFTNLRIPQAAKLNVFGDRPGQMFVAIGLALQGLDQARIDLNLAPQEKKFSLKTWSSTLLRKRPQKTAWGLDLNCTGLKAVKLEVDPAGTPSIVAAVFIPHHKPLNQPDGEAERSAIVTETLQAFLAEHSLAEARVAVNLPMDKLLGRFFDLPPVADDKLAGAVEFEARHQIPYALSELAWDWSLTDAKHVENSELPRRVVVTAARRFHMEQQLAAFQAAGITPEILTNDCTALHNFVYHEFFGASADAPAGTVAALDVGARSSNLVITSPGVHWFRSIPIGGDHFNETLVRDLKLTWAQAETLKREPFRARRMSRLYAALGPLCADLTSEVARSFEAFETLYRDQTISCLYGLGGGFQLHGLWRQLRAGR